MFDKARGMRSNPSFRCSPDDEIVPGVRFGREDELLTPAYWAMRCTYADLDEIDFVNRHGSLADEIGFCLLGGFGVTLEVATAFYERLRQEGVFDQSGAASESEIYALLVEPALVNGRPHKYRFPNQRARRISKAMQAFGDLDVVGDPVLFRNQIQTLEGVGPKTASWITRNWFDTDEVAILDIHVLRAGWLISLFDRTCRLPKDYVALEQRFIAFAKELHVRASVLDAVIWSDMRMFGSDLAREMAA